MNCDPACRYVTHYVPKIGHIHHTLMCPNHPNVTYERKHLDIPPEVTRPVKYAVQTRRSAVEYWWKEGKTPAWLAEQFMCSVYTINDDIRWLRIQGRISVRPRQLVTRETLNAER